jgi:endogenous inhibitor of DNA gyrase (YacG/DUF329 family)
MCVLCRTRPVAEPWRPFCSERCRNEDLARWAEERYKMAAEPAPDTAPDAEADPD